MILGSRGWDADFGNDCEELNSAMSERGGSHDCARVKAVRRTL
jgi:hypothetical protein